MKYSILILIFAISVFAQNADLDKPANISMGSTLKFQKNAGCDYLNEWSIDRLVKYLCGETIESTDDRKDNNGNYTQSYRWNKLDENTIYSGHNDLWDNHWDNTDFAAIDNDTNKTNVNLLTKELNKYRSDFPGIMQLFDATKNGWTSSVNNYTGTLSGSQEEITSSNSLANTPGLNLVIYAGRNTSAENNLRQTLTIATSERVYHVYAYDTSTPIVLDLDGDGKLEASKGQHLPHTLCVPESELVAFDINADGFEELVEWVGANDGLLVHDITNNEVSGKNLFGDATGFKDGFEQLATLDANKDDALTGEELAGLAVWQDKNGNAKIDDGEIHSLESLGITKLNVKAIELTATFERNGKYYMMWDWNPVTIMVKKAK